MEAMIMEDSELFGWIYFQRMYIDRFRRRPVREEYDFFNSKPQQHRRGPTKETDLDRGEIN